MAENEVVKEDLTDSMLTAGAELTRRMDEVGLRPAASLWFYVPDRNEWRLILGIPGVEVEGPMKAYTTLQTTLNKQPIEGFNLQNILLTSEKNDLFVALRQMLGNRPGPDIHNIRFSKNVIGNLFIDDAYVYRL